MKLRRSLVLLAFLCAPLPSCSSESSSGAGSKAPAPGTAGELGGPVELGSDGGASAVQSGGSAAGVAPAAGGAPAASGASAAGGSAGSPALTLGGAAGATDFSGYAPTTWNSARSALLTDVELEAEYVAWKQAHVTACSNGTSVVVTDEGAVVSEGIGYGMLLSVAQNDQPLFEGLWKYYQDHLNANGLMTQTTENCAPPGNSKQNAATDADLDAAMALVQAAQRWPNGGYLDKARAQASKIAQYESEMCDGRRVLRPGDGIGGCSDPVAPRVNPSYFSPGYYQVFAHYFVEQAALWTALRDGSYQLFALYQARLDNLVPDWSGADGSDSQASYGTEACRSPWRVSVDYAWTGDSRAKTFMQNISSWVDAHGGLPAAAPQQNSAFIGALALSGGYEQGKFDGYLSRWLAAPVDDSGYYSGTLRVLYLLVAAGKFSSTL